MIWFPFAKINLGLSVLNKRNDGFHNIESLLHPIALYDILEIVKSKKDEFTLSGFSINTLPENNLVLKTVNILREYISFSPIKIHLHKQIPIESGLGGGSSDATHTLLGICQLFNLKINDDKLIEISGRLGSDCPFFLKSKTQYVKGRGEILEDFELNIIPFKLLLVIPDFSISTKTAFDRNTPKEPEYLPYQALNMPIEYWKSILKNDFEEIVFADFPILGEIKKKLYQQGAVYASLSGSGSSIYGLFSKQIEINLPQNFKYHWLDFSN